MLIQLKPQTSSHWYTADGSPCYEVPCATREGTRPTTLADARKLKLLPSVTTVERILDKPQVNDWRVGVGMEAMLHALRSASKEDVQWLLGRGLDIVSSVPVEAPTNGELRRWEAWELSARDEAERRMTVARDLGLAVHAAIESDLGGQVAPWPPGMEAARNAFRDFVDTMQDGFEVERVVTHPLGYAGRVDCIATVGGHLTVIDWKTQGTKPGRKVNAYDSWGRQLAAYAEAIGAPLETRLVNVVISTTEPGRLEVIDCTAKRAELWADFRAIYHLWCQLNRYWPAGEFTIAEASQVLKAGEVAAAPQDVTAGAFLAQVSGLRQLVNAEWRVSLDISPEEGQRVRRSDLSVGSMVGVALVNA